MTQIILDANLTERLQTSHQSVELCDPSGKVIGRFAPKIDLSKVVRALPAISDEELQRRSKSNEKRYTTAEVIAYLEKL